MYQEFDMAKSNGSFRFFFPLNSCNFCGPINFIATEFPRFLNNAILLKELKSKIKNKDPQEDH